MLTANKARAALDVIQMVSGKTVPLPDPPTDRKNEKLALRHEMASMDAVLAFLRAHGAMLAHVKPEMLLPLEEYMKLMLSGGGRYRARSARRSERTMRHGIREGWIDVLFQSIKVFVLGRITPKRLPIAAWHGLRCGRHRKGGFVTRRLTALLASEVLS